MSGTAADVVRPPHLARLKIRADFLRVSAGQRVHSRSLSLQAARRAPDDVAASRVGLTVTRKAGGAVERNRIKRRLREALRAELPIEEGHDFVVVARREAISTPFKTLVAELRRCFDDHRIGRARASVNRRKPGASKAEAMVRLAAKSSANTSAKTTAKTSAKIDLAAGRGPAACDLRPDREPA